MIPSKAFYLTTKNMSVFHNCISSFWAKHLSTLSESEIASLNAECDRIICLLHTPFVKLTREGVLEAVLAALYYERFGESPTMTMINSTIEEQRNDL